jgi:hypothetical protein
MNNNTTKVVLQGKNYTVVQQVKGSASGVTVLGFGGSFSPLIENARSEMLSSANLVGGSRAVINEIVEVNNKRFVVFSLKTVTVSAYVVEFTGAAPAAKIAATQVNTKEQNAVSEGNTPAVVDQDVVSNTEFDTDVDFESNVEFDDDIDFQNSTAATNNRATASNRSTTNSAEIAQRPADTEAIEGQWSRENDGLVLTINGNVGVLTQVTSGFWFRLVNEGRVTIGSQLFRNFTKIDATTWRVQELVVGTTTSNWRTTTMTLEGNTLTIGNPQNGYILTR